MSARQDGPELTEIVYDASPENTSLKLAILHAQIAWQENSQNRLGPRQKAPVAPAPVVHIHPSEASHAHATRDTRGQTEAHAALVLRASTKISLDQLNARRARSILTRLQPAAARRPAGVTPAAAVVTVGPAPSAVRASSKQHPGLRRAVNVSRGSFRLMSEQRPAACARGVRRAPHLQQGALHLLSAGANRGQLVLMAACVLIVPAASLRRCKGAMLASIAMQAHILPRVAAPP